MQVERPRLKGAVVLNVRMVAEPKCMAALPLVLFFLGGFPWVTGQAMVGSAAGVLVEANKQTPSGCLLYSSVLGIPSWPLIGWRRVC